MKFSRSALFLAATSPLIFAHSAAAQTMPADAATPAVAASNVGRQLDAKAVILRVQPQVGARYRARQFSRVEMQLPKTRVSPAGTGLAISKATFDMDVMGRDAWGGTTFRLTYRDFELTKFGTIYQALPPERRHEIEQQRVKTREAVIGQSFSLKVAPTGQLWSLIIPEELGNNLYAIMSSGFGISTIGLLAQRINNRENKDGASAILPVNPLRLEDSWNYNAPLLTISNLPYALRGQRTLKGIDNGVALIAESGALSVPPQMASEVAALTGTLSGISRIDIASGLPLETNLTTRINGEIVGLDNNGKPKNYPISSVVQDRLIIEVR